MLRLLNFISHLDIDEKLNILEKERKELLNQYHFFVSIILLINGIRDLFLQLYFSAFLLLLFFSYFLISFFITKLRFNKNHLFCIHILLNFIIFLFTLIYGRYAKIEYLYFPILVSPFFLFNLEVKKEFIKIISCLLCSLFFYFLNFYTDYSIFHYYNLSINIQKYIANYALLESIVMLILGAIYYNKKRKQLDEFFLQKMNSKKLIESLKTELKLAVLDPEVNKLKDIIYLEKNNDFGFTDELKKNFPKFYNALSEINPKLSDDDFWICSLLKLGFSTKDIALYNNLSVRSVESRKYRIRKQFKIPPDINIYHWVNSL